MDTGNKERLQILNIIYDSTKNLSNNGVSIVYISLKFEGNKSLLYQSIHRLLEEDTITQSYSTECPVCGNENENYDNSRFTQCDNCGERYVNNNIIEKYKLNSRMFEYE
jgi:ribosomal protein L37AE/L43A